MASIAVMTAVRFAVVMGKWICSSSLRASQGRSGTRSSLFGSNGGPKGGPVCREDATSTLRSCDSDTCEAATPTLRSCDSNPGEAATPTLKRSGSKAACILATWRVRIRGPRRHASFPSVSKPSSCRSFSRRNTVARWQPVFFASVAAAGWARLPSLFAYRANVTARSLRRRQRCFRCRPSLGCAKALGGRSTTSLKHLIGVVGVMRRHQAKSAICDPLACFPGGDPGPLMRILAGCSPIRAFLRILRPLRRTRN